MKKQLSAANVSIRFLCNLVHYIYYYICTLWYLHLVTNYALIVYIWLCKSRKLDLVSKATFFLNLFHSHVGFYKILNRFRIQNSSVLKSLAIYQQLWLFLSLFKGRISLCSCGHTCVHVYYRHLDENSWFLLQGSVLKYKRDT